MRYIAIIFVFGFLLMSCDNHKIKGDDNVVLDSLQSEQLKIAFLNDTSYTKSPWIPTYNQLEVIDSITRIAVKERNSPYFRYLAPDSIRNYFRQYVFSIDSKGDSLVFINAICRVGDRPIIDKNGTMYYKRSDWQHEIESVFDGGDCFWRISINFSTRKCLYFTVNGLA